MNFRPVQWLGMLVGDLAASDLRRLSNPRAKPNVETVRKNCFATRLSHWHSGPVVTTLSREEARSVYDRIGARQDSQAFYEDRATEFVLSHGEFAYASRVFEFGCGTGRFALRLISEHLPETACYQGVDLSPTMVELARQRLLPYVSRAEVLLTDGSPPTVETMGRFDRFVSNYVLDLLSADDIAAVIREAHRMLEPHGLLCLSSLSMGSGLLSRLVARAWGFVHAIRPSLVGGCRPLDLLAWLPQTSWQVRHHTRVAPFGVPSEVVIAEARNISSV
jgi:SAM-dependent methyltransferase